MIVNLGDVAAMMLLGSAENIVLPGRKRRRIRIEFNVDTPATLYLIRRKGDMADPQFLADLNGFTVVEFVGEGRVELQLATENGAQVWYSTPEAETAVTANGAEAASFAKLHTPRARNHQMEMMQYQMEQNMRAMQVQMRDEFERRLAANPGVHPVTGEVIEQEEKRDGKPKAKTSGKPAKPEPDPDEGAGDGDGASDEAEPGNDAKAKSD